MITQSYLRPQTVLFFVFWLVGMVLLRAQPFADPGALWHIRVGEWIFEHGAFPYTDPFTWSYADRFWIPQQWGAECLMALLHRLGGFDTLLLAMVTLLAWLGSWIGKRFVDAGVHPMLAGMMVGFGMAVAAFHFYLRPHLSTILFMGVVMGFLIDLERQRISVRRWFWLIPLCIIWTNLHGGVLGGVATLGLAVAGWFGFYLLKIDSPIRRLGTFVQLSAIVILCGATVLVNPFGVRMLEIWQSIVGSQVLKIYISEHQPLSLQYTFGIALVVFAAFYLMMLLGTFPKRPQISWLLPLVWFALSCQSIRHGPLFCITALVALSDLFPHTYWYRLLQKYGDTLIGPANPQPTTWRGYLLPLLVVAITLKLHMLQVSVPIVGQGWAQLRSKDHPIELIAPLQNYAQSKPEGTPIFNDANLGGFLLYFTPKLKIFMDDRCELYRDEGILDYVDLIEAHPERIDQYADQVPFDRILISPDGTLDQYLQQHPTRYQELQRCPKAVLYEVKR